MGMSFQLRICHFLWAVLTPMNWTCIEFGPSEDCSLELRSFAPWSLEKASQLTRRILLRLSPVSWEYESILYLCRFPSKPLEWMAFSWHLQLIQRSQFNRGWVRIFTVTQTRISWTSQGMDQSNLQDPFSWNACESLHLLRESHNGCQLLYSMWEVFSFFQSSPAFSSGISRLDVDRSHTFC